jgi:hypothetical protein
MSLNKLKISDLPLSQDLTGLYTIGVNASNQSVKIALQWLKDNADKVQDAVDAALAANNAATSANNAASSASSAAKSAGAAATNAQTQANAAATTIATMEKLMAEIIALYKLQPTKMQLTYPKIVTLGNDIAKKIEFILTPTGCLQNCLFISDNNAVNVMPDGTLKVQKTGTSVVQVIPPENTALYQTIQIEVRDPVLRLATSTSLRLTEDGKMRLT